MLFDMESPAAWVVRIEEARGADPRVIFQGNEVHARERFIQVKAAMRYGVVALVDPRGEVMDLMGRAFPARPLPKFARSATAPLISMGAPLTL